MSEDDATHVPEWWNEGSIEIELQEANPKQPGSKAFERYNQYREARTVADAIKQGASREDLQNDRKKGFLKMTGKTPDGKIRRKSHSPLQEMDGMEDGAEERLDSASENNRACGFCRMTYCRLCHPSVKRELDFDADTDAASSASGDRIYAAIAALSRKIDRLSSEVATKKDVRDHVTEQLKPVTNEIADLRQRVESMEAPGPTSDISPEMRRSMDHLMTLSRQMDPNMRRVSFLGFRDDATDTSRRDAMTNFLRKYPHHKYESLGHEYKGKPGERIMKNVSYVEFASTDAAKSFMKEAGSGQFPIQGITVKPALSKIHRQRNYAIRKAEEMIKERAPGKEVKADLKQRIVTLEGSTVFEQTSSELGGTFRGTMSSLRLP